MLYPIPQKEILALINARNSGSPLKDGDLAFEILSHLQDGTLTVKVTPAEGVQYYGEQTITYRKRDLAKSVLGVPVRMLVGSDTTVRALITLFATKYGFSFDQATDFAQAELDKPVSFAESGIQVVEVPSADTSLVWFGSLSIEVSNDALDLSTIIAKADLTELHYLSGAGTIASIALLTQVGDFSASKDAIDALKVGDAVPSALATAIADALKAQEVLDGDEADLITALTGQTLKSKTVQDDAFIAFFNAVNDNASYAGGAILHYGQQAPIQTTPPAAGSSDFSADNKAQTIEVPFTVNRDANQKYTARLGPNSPSYATLASKDMVYKSADGANSIYAATVNIAGSGQKEGDQITVIMSDADGNDVGSYVIGVTKATAEPKVNVYEVVWGTQGVSGSNSNISVNFGSARGTIDWGDGVVTQYTGGTVQKFYDAKYVNPFKATLTESTIIAEPHTLQGPGITEIKQWVNHTVTSLVLGSTAVNGGVYWLTKVPEKLPKSWTNLNATFAGTQVFNQDLSMWDTSNILQMFSTFKGSKAFNGNISTWNTSNVNNMRSMFEQAAAFNSDISKWDYSKVTNANSMFANSSVYNQPMPNVNWAAATDLGRIFNAAAKFNQPLTGWKFPKITTLASMFQGASAFNGDLNDWDVSNITDISYMFASAGSFNKPLNNWNTAKVKNMSGLMNKAYFFNQNLSGWNTSAVTSHTDFDTSANQWAAANKPKFAS